MTRAVVVDLSAVVLALAPDEEQDGGRAAHAAALVTEDGRLPTVTFDPDSQRTLELTLRDRVRADAGLDLGYVEQLYTFGDSARRAEGGDAAAPHAVSIGYLALARRAGAPPPRHAWSRWDRYFPWEDRRPGAAQPLDALRAALADWAAEDQDRADRVAAFFPEEAAAWRDELVLDRYELLYEAGLVAEAWRDRGEETPAWAADGGGGGPGALSTGRPLWRDHRRILATGIARLRGKLKYRPVLFELMPRTFTLLELQRAAEAVQGVVLHKQNFRRQVERSGLVEPTGTMTSRHGGRPAAEFRFTADAGWERVMTPVRFGGARKG
ncbi:NUDIX hydrolase [Rhodovulum sp. DZ06]|uniref:NUDIX hydrolase n=1 Tax=Rhodovulum sp. DZ06 TaxID=3425126 RepID=UPI003D33B2A5